MEIPTEGPFAHLMWSDPEETIKDWQISPRGAGFMFGFNIVKKFNHINNLDFIVRAHQLIMEGYKHLFNEMLVTIWSAPNYCYRYYFILYLLSRMNNKATILQIDENLNKNYLLFKESP
jgi:serine/threonine-protein phosphatase 4 catalytic subunit